MRERASKLLAVCLGCVVCALSSISCHTQVTTAAGNRLIERLSQVGEQQLRSIVAGGRLPDLAWPNFARHSVSVKEFYEEIGYMLGWIQGGKPTPQALELIGILEEADNNGLDTRDYDGARWPDRLKSLQTGGAEEESIHRTGQLTVRQKPGPKNALGLAKFIFSERQQRVFALDASPILVQQNAA
jgi:Scaffold domain